jgi:hypothetical protein
MATKYVHMRKEVGGACSKYGERSVPVLASKSEGRIILGIPRRRREDNIKIFIQGVKSGRRLK